MKITIKNALIFINWSYGNPLLDQLIKENEDLLVDAGFNIENAHALKKNKLEEILKIGALPLPTVVSCFLKDAETGEILIAKTLSGKIVKSKEIGRTKSLAKALLAFLPGIENKELRREVWNEYHGRKGTPEFKLFQKLMNKYENILKVAA